jgi:hypothetical protein
MHRPIREEYETERRHEQDKSNGEDSLGGERRPRRSLCARMTVERTGFSGGGASEPNSRGLFDRPRARDFTRGDPGRSPHTLDTRDGWARASRSEVRQRPRELGEIFESTLGVLLEATTNDDLEAGRCIGTEARQSQGLRGGNVEDDLGQLLPQKTRLPRDELEQNDADGPDVAPRIRLSRRLHLLGRHVKRRTQQRPGSRHPEVGPVHSSAGMTHRPPSHWSGSTQPICALHASRSRGRRTQTPAHCAPPPHRSRSSSHLAPTPTKVAFLHAPPSQNPQLPHLDAPAASPCSSHPPLLRSQTPRFPGPSRTTHVLKKQGS